MFYSGLKLMCVGTVMLFCTIIELISMISQFLGCSNSKPPIENKFVEWDATIFGNVIIWEYYNSTDYCMDFRINMCIL